MCNLPRFEKLGFPVETRKVLRSYPKCATYDEQINWQILKKPARRQKKLSSIFADKTSTLKIDTTDNYKP